MPPGDSAIRPETCALDALIARTITDVKQTRAGQAADAMLFLGARHDAFPALLIGDPVLEPVDKIVWMVICQHGRAAGTVAPFPSHERIAREANIASHTTVTRAIAILRATRWLSLCARVRDREGRFRGNVYALHDEPLPLADALHLDPGYMAFIAEAAKTHHHARVRKIAQAVLDSIDLDIQGGHDPLASIDPKARRITAQQAAQRNGSQRYFAFSAAVLPSLHAQAPASRGRRTQAAQRKDPSAHRAPPLTTTRDATASVGENELRYPRRLNENQREIAARYLARIPPEHRQAVLDELEGRFRAERLGAKPIYDELRYLHDLCIRATTGRFEPNLGLKVGAERESQATAIAAAPAKGKGLATERRRGAGKNDDPLAEVRRILGVPKRSDRA